MCKSQGEEASSNAFTKLIERIEVDKYLLSEGKKIINCFILCSRAERTGEKVILPNFYSSHFCSSFKFAKSHNNSDKALT